MEGNTVVGINNPLMSSDSDDGERLGLLLGTPVEKYNKPNTGNPFSNYFVTLTNLPK